MVKIKSSIKLLHISMLLIVITAFFGSLSGVKAQDTDERWKLVVTNATDDYFYDSLTVSEIGDTITIWVKTVYKEKLKDEDDKEMKSSINSLSMVCGSNRYTMSDVEITYKDGSKKKVDYEEVNKPIKPESIFEKFYMKFCQKEENN